MPADSNNLGWPSVSHPFGPSLLGRSYCLPGSPSELTAPSAEEHCSDTLLLRISPGNTCSSFTVNFKCTSYSRTRLHIDLWSSSYRNHSAFFWSSSSLIVPLQWHSLAVSFTLTTIPSAHGYKNILTAQYLIMLFTHTFNEQHYKTHILSLQKHLNACHFSAMVLHNKIYRISSLLAQFQWPQWSHLSSVVNMVQIIPSIFQALINI